MRSGIGSLLLVCATLSVLNTHECVAENRIGEEKTFTYSHVVRARVAYPHSESGSQPLDVPRGWHIIGSDVQSHVSFGQNSWNISIFGDDSTFLTETYVNEVVRDLEKVARDSGNEDKYRSEIETLKKRFLDARSKIQSSHNRATLNWKCKHDGNESDRKGGSLDLTVKLTCVRFMEVDEAKLRLEEMKSRIKEGKSINIPLPTLHAPDHVFGQVKNAWHISSGKEDESLGGHINWSQNNRDRVTSEIHRFLDEIDSSLPSLDRVRLSRVNARLKDAASRARGEEGHETGGTEAWFLKVRPDVSEDSIRGEAQRWMSELRDTL